MQVVGLVDPPGVSQLLRRLLCPTPWGVLTVLGDPSFGGDVDSNSTG